LGANATLVTGCGGFVGSWLVPALQRSGHAVIGLERPGSVPDTPELDCLEIDLRDRNATHDALKWTRPAQVVHLAAMAAPLEAAADPIEALRVNYIAVDHLLSALASHAPDSRLLYVGTGDVYGLQAADAPPFDEASPIRPPNLYAATKAAAERRVELAFERDGLDVVRARPFNHTGPGRPPSYVEASFARQLALIERSTIDPVLRVGNLESIRDFSDVRDVVDAYRLMLEQGQRGEVYNVCSKHGRRISEVLDHLLAVSGATPSVVVDPDLFRPAAPDQLASVGDPARLRELGWRPRYTFDQTVADVLDDWRERA
jgi:GDP-4-dehydro-6-deoxy-D-mannose reductase